MLLSLRVFDSENYTELLKDNPIEIFFTPNRVSLLHFGPSLVFEWDLYGMFLIFSGTIGDVTDSSKITN